MLYSFADFLEESGEDKNYFINGKKICHNDGAETTIAKNYIEVIRVSVEEIFGNGVEFQIEFKSPNEKIRDSIFIKIFHTEKIRCN